MEAYDPRTNQWTSDLVVSIPVPPYYMVFDGLQLTRSRDHIVAAVAPNCDIYAITNDAAPVGGHNQVEVFSFDPTSRTYMNAKLGADLPGFDRIYAAISTHDGHIYALGDTTEFEFDGVTWKDRRVSKPMLGMFLGPTDHPGSAATLGGDGRIYVMDGRSLYSVAPPNLLYPPATAMPYHTSDFASANAEGRVFAMGTEDSHIDSYGPIPAYLSSIRRHWRFDGKVADEKGCSTTLSNGPASYSAGRVGQALLLNGMYTVLAAPGCADVTDYDFTIEFWMKHDGSAAPFAVQSILDKRMYAAGYQGYHVYFYNNMGAQGGTIGVQLANQTLGYTNYGSSLPIPKDQWTHVAITVHRAAMGGAIWINGALAGQFTPTTATLTSTAPLNIGGSNSSTTANFKGALDELTILNRALSWPEVRSVLLAGAQGTL